MAEEETVLVFNPYHTHADEPVACYLKGPRFLIDKWLKEHPSYQEYDHHHPMNSTLIMVAGDNIIEL